MRGIFGFRGRGPAALLLAFAILVLAPGRAVAAWDGTQDIILGDRIGAEFGSADISVHAYSFYAPAGTVVGVKGKVAKGSNLVLSYELLNDMNVPVPLGAALLPGSAGIKNFVTTEATHYVLRVTAQSGEGMYFLTTTGKFPKALKAKVALNSTTKLGTVSFGSFEGALLSGAVKPSIGSAVATAQFTKLTCPGEDMGITPGASVNAVVLDHTTVFTMTVSGDVAGDVDVSLKIKNPKFLKRTWSFGAVEIAPGTPSAIRAEWMTSPHNDRGAEAFRHWDEDGEVEVGCAKCHSSGGYQDWLGTDGSAFESVDAPAPLGTTVDCNACHNNEAATLDTVLFPSGKRVDGLGGEARCLQCHQGRESTTSVDALITAAGVADDAEMPTAQNKFLNVHYLAAGATFYGTAAKGAYEYAGKVYNGKFSHVQSYDSCIECHDQHSTELRLTECATCHTGVAAKADVKNIRMTRSVYDYDGDGNVAEGISGEIDGMAAILFGAIQAYGTDLGFPIAYSTTAYPYWFNDANANGAVDAGETKYTHWTPRMERAAYNYQFYLKDPGAYAHNARYVMEVLYDSTADLATQVTVAGLAGMRRAEADFGHFDATSDAYRDWDDDMMVNTSCAQCHSSEGFKTYIGNVNVSSSGSITEISQTPASPAIQGMPCESCHIDGVFDQAGVAKLRYVKVVVFPSNRTSQVGAKKITNGAQGTAAEDPSFTCMSCHQGRNSKQTIDDYFAWNTDSTKWSFQNVHYAAVGAMQYGKDAGVGYEYSGKTYVGKWVHGSDANSRCTFCHMQNSAIGKKNHAFKPDPANTTCQTCHGATANIEEFGRIPGQLHVDATDYDGDGDATEELKDEVQAYADALYDAIRTASEANGAKLVYEGHTNPYWFWDKDGDNLYDSTIDASSTGKWTVALMRACHNYQFWAKETQGWAHNRKYVMELLYDSIDDLNGGVDGDVPTLTRP
jgi:hypothetical protein